MRNLIEERTVENIIRDLGVRITNETTPEEMIKIVKMIVVKAINSIDHRALAEAVTEEIMRELRRHGVRV